MKIQILGSSLHDTARRQYVSSYLVNGTVAIDAGCLGFYGTCQEQEAIRHVFLTHSHADHTASLPIFVENVRMRTGDCPRIYGSTETLDAVQKHIFNGVIWPDYVVLSKNMPPFMDLCPLQPEVAVEADGLQVTPVSVDHVVPTFGYVVSDGESAVVFGGDSGPTKRLWEIARQVAGLRAVFLEASFPNSMARLAKKSCHLTAEMFDREVAKIPAGVKVVAVHIKSHYHEQVVRELHALQLPNVVISECGREYNF
jgi:ribonuclease BN (tRNA processing enzyme)